MAHLENSFDDPVCTMLATSYPPLKVTTLPSLPLIISLPLPLITNMAAVPELNPWVKVTLFCTLSVKVPLTGTFLVKVISAETSNSPLVSSRVHSLAQAVGLEATRKRASSKAAFAPVRGVNIFFICFVFLILFILFVLQCCFSGGGQKCKNTRLALWVSKARAGFGSMAARGLAMSSWVKTFFLRINASCYLLFFGRQNYTFFTTWQYEGGFFSQREFFKAGFLSPLA